jgi:hypothetical protein
MLANGRDAIPAVVFSFFSKDREISVNWYYSTPVGNCPPLLMRSRENWVLGLTEARCIRTTRKRYATYVDAFQDIDAC